MNYPLNKYLPLGSLLSQRGINSWNEAIDFIRNLPYGRNSDRADFSLVVRENQGTCSSKHAFLMLLAMENKLTSVKLIMGLYTMTSKNTPKIQNTLKEYGLQGIPEAHCYLSIKGQRMDFTSPKASFELIKEDIILEKEIAPQDVVQWKVDFHKQYLRTWCTENSLDFSELWNAREDCIKSLGQ